MLSTSPELARRALEAAPDAIIIIDACGQVCYANRQVSVLFGYPHDQIVSANVEQLMPERFRARHIMHPRQYESSARVRPMGAGLELLGRRSDGTEFPVEISLSPIQDGDRWLVAAAIRDVSARKRAETELIAARHSAELAREEADRANVSKSRFLATASHDLRQPLQSLSLLNGALRRATTDPDSMEMLMQQEQAISSVSRLLNALLDISKLESGAIRPEPEDFSVRALFEELRAEFAGMAREKGLDFEISASEDYGHSDPSLVQQILRNLIANAIKYTRQGAVLLRCLRGVTTICIEVVDTGVGIPAEQLPLIYEEFYQVGVPTHSTRDGYGLGLSIVQRIVKLLKLKLEVTSEVGRGSAFFLTLPQGRSVAAQSSRSTAETSTPSIGTAHVLLVDDDAGVRQATRLLLRVEGYRVTAVSSLAEAVRASCEQHDIDILVTDYHLRDGETGIQVITELRKILGASLKAVLITGDTSSSVKDIPRDQHMRVISKPIQADELLTLLRALLAT